MPWRRRKRKQLEAPSAFIRVRETAERLGISEDLAYRMANEYLGSSGAAGIPCAPFGRRLLVSRNHITRLVQVNLGTTCPTQPVGGSWPQWRCRSLELGAQQTVYGADDEEEFRA